MELSAPTTPPKLPPINVVIKPNPNFGQRQRGDLLVSARTDFQDTTKWTRTRWGIWDRAVDVVRQLDGGSFDDAVAAAKDVLAQDRRDTRWGLLRRHQGRVDALAVLEAERGWKLVRVDAPVDSYIDTVPGAMFPGQTHTVDPLNSIFRKGDVRRERADVAALVGATHTFDLRATSPSTPTEPF
jgi:hypothetical protein